MEKFSQLCRSKLCTPLRGGRRATHENVAEMQVVRNMNAETGITMGNKGKKTEEKRRNYWIIGLVLASSAILLYILIYLSFAGNGFIPTGEYLTKGDWLAFLVHIYPLWGRH